MQASIFRFLPLLFLLTLISCAHTDGGGEETYSEMPPASENTDFYYDFDDILVPKEMDLLTKESFILETPSSKSGVMVFRGKVEISSLTNFFINNMMKDNWQLRSAFKSQRTILVFEKPDRYCVINITDDKFYTFLEIWVAPRSGDGSQVIAPSTGRY